MPGEDHRQLRVKEEEKQQATKGKAGLIESIPTVPLPPSNDDTEGKRGHEARKEGVGTLKSGYAGPVATDLKKVKEFMSRQKY